MPADKLSEIPESPTQPTPREAEVMNKMFGNTTADDDKASPKRSVSWKDAFIKAGYVSLLFLVLANNYIDVAFNLIPYCKDNALLMLGVKTLFFGLIFIILYKFVM